MLLFEQLLTALKAAGLSPDQIFHLLFTIFIFLGLVVVGFIWYLHRLLSIYSQRVDAVMEWNKKFLLPMYFKYSWLRGVALSVHEKQKGTTDRSSSAPPKV